MQDYGDFDWHLPWWRLVLEGSLIFIVLLTLAVVVYVEDFFDKIRGVNQ